MPSTFKQLRAGFLGAGLLALGATALATPALARHAHTESIYKSEKFSDHAPITIDYDFTLQGS